MRSSATDKQTVDFVLRLLTPENRTVMKICLATGLRVSDALAIKTDDLRQWSFTLREAKTGKKRKIELTPELRREALRWAGSVYAFPHRDDGFRHRTRQAVWKDVRRAAKALRIKEHISTHSARKIYAENLMKRYGDVEKVRKALNHVSADVTMFYYLCDYYKNTHVNG